MPTVILIPNCCHRFDAGDVHQYSSESVLKLQLITAQEHARIRCGDANIIAKPSKVDVTDGKISLQTQQEYEHEDIVMALWPI